MPDAFDLDYLDFLPEKTRAELIAMSDEALIATTKYMFRICDGSRHQEVGCAVMLLYCQDRGVRDLLGLDSASVQKWAMTRLLQGQMKPGVDGPRKIGPPEQSHPEFDSGPINCP